MAAGVASLWRTAGAKLFAHQILGDLFGINGWITSNIGVFIHIYICIGYLISDIWYVYLYLYLYRVSGIYIYIYIYINICICLCLCIGMIAYAHIEATIIWYLGPSETGVLPPDTAIHDICADLQIFFYRKYATQKTQSVHIYIYIIYIYMTFKLRFFWISRLGVRENRQDIIIFGSKINSMVSHRFFLKPIHWVRCIQPFLWEKTYGMPSPTGKEHIF